MPSRKCMMLDEDVLRALEVLDDSDDNPMYQASDEEKDSNAFSGFPDHKDMLN